MSDTISFQVGKFIFRVATDRRYSAEGVWAKQEGSIFRLGISDYLQQRSGDVAFAEVKPTGTELKAGVEFAVIETIKVNIGLSSPIAGKVVDINPLLEATPEVINQEPFGSGWLAIIEGREGEAGLKHLMSASDYYAKIKLEAEQEIYNNE